GHDVQRFIQVSRGVRRHFFPEIPREQVNLIRPRGSAPKQEHTRPGPGCRFEPRNVDSIRGPVSRALDRAIAHVIHEKATSLALDDYEQYSVARNMIAAKLSLQAQRSFVNRGNRDGLTH